MKLGSRLLPENILGTVSQGMNIRRHTIEEIWKQQGHRVCTATHPNMPVFNGNSRGRKIHLDSGDAIYTLCNQLVDEYIPADDKEYTMVSNGWCKACLGVLKKRV